MFIAQETVLFAEDVSRTSWQTDYDAEPICVDSVNHCTSKEMPNLDSVNHCTSKTESRFGISKFGIPIEIRKCLMYAGIGCSRLKCRGPHVLLPPANSFIIGPAVINTHTRPVRDERTHPHTPRLVVSHSTCPPLSSSPPANSFVINCRYGEAQAAAASWRAHDGRRQRGTVCPHLYDSLPPASSSLTHARRMDGFCNQNADQATRACNGKRRRGGA